MSDLFNKHIRKATSRTKEKLLEGIGKAKATQDEVFDQHAANLSKQSKACERLHKDIKTYAQALKTLCAAEIALRDTIREAYEPEWPDRPFLTSIFDNLDIRTNELEKRICEDLTQSVTQYVNQFADLKKKVEKRGRKLVDYDSAKNTYNSVKASNKKGDQDPKLAKAHTELQQAEAMYVDMNNELLEVLPATYDSRITFFVDTLQTLYNANSIYEVEASKLHKQVVTQLDTLGESMDHLRVARPEPRAITPIDKIGVDTNGADGDTTRLSTPSPIVVTVPTTPQASAQTTPASKAGSTPAAGNGGEPTNPFEESDDDVVVVDHDQHNKPERSDSEEKVGKRVYPKLNAEQREAADKAIAAAKKEKENEKDKDATNPFDDDEEEVKEKEYTVEKEPMAVERLQKAEETKPVPLDGSVPVEPRKVMFVVKTTHEYKAVDTDELSFSPGFEIKVLESKESDQLDEGWRLGEMPDGKRGVFPENFTRRV